MNLIKKYNIDLSKLPPHTMDQEEEQIEFMFSDSHPWFFVDKKQIEIGFITGFFINESGFCVFVDCVIESNYKSFSIVKSFNSLGEATMSGGEYTLQDLYKRKNFVSSLDKVILKNMRKILKGLFISSEVTVY